MISLIQLVTHASVVVDKVQIGLISRGILALVGIEKTDTEAEACKLIERIINYRIFPDSDGKTNLSLKIINGGLLLVPQFTLIADTSKGSRPGFSMGMPPVESEKLFTYLVNEARRTHPTVESGKFGAYMQVSLCNDGPMTFQLKT
jgi:D-tyrosyl-tRNA(Tyr) deacylase